MPKLKLTLPTTSTHLVASGSEWGSDYASTDLKTSLTKWGRTLKETNADAAREGKLTSALLPISRVNIVLFHNSS